MRAVKRMVEVRQHTFHGPLSESANFSYMGEDIVAAQAQCPGFDVMSELITVMHPEGISSFHA